MIMATSVTLVEAVRAGDVSRVREALAAGAELRTDNGGSLILEALFRGQQEIVSLLAAQAELDIFEAAALGRTERVSPILQSDPAAANKHAADGWTALHLAGFLAHVGAAECLLDGGAKVGALSTNREANTPLHAAIAGKCDAGMVALLVKRGADVNARANLGVTPLHLAASRGNQEIIDHLLSHGANIHATMDDGKSVEAIAMERGHQAVAEHIRRTAGKA